MKKLFIRFIPVVVILIIIFFKSYKDLYGIETLNNNVKTNISSIITKSEKQELTQSGLIILDKNSREVNYNIKIKNNHNYKTKYSLYLLSINSNVDLYDIKYSIKNVTSNLENVKNNNYIIYSEELKPNETKKHNLRIWTDNNNKSIYLKMNETLLKKNITLFDYLNTQVTNQDNYYIDMDSANGLYKIDNKYKYIGNIPNNYIYFNCNTSNLSTCELWRIIGIEKVLLNSLQEEYRVKIIKDSFEYKSKYENIKYEPLDEYIEKVILNKDGLFLQHTYNILTLEDYRDAYSHGYDDNCYYNIMNCKKISYLNKKEDEWIKGDSDSYLYLSKNNNIQEGTNLQSIYFRPTIYLKKSIILENGNGTIETPYLIK